jgi:hypothetical protein
LVKAIVVIYLLLGSVSMAKATARASAGRSGNVPRGTAGASDQCGTYSVGIIKLLIRHARPHDVGGGFIRLAFWGKPWARALTPPTIMMWGPVLTPIVVRRLGLGEGIGVADPGETLIGRAPQGSARP